MKTKFFYQIISWKPQINEINFVGAYLGNNRGKKFQVDGLKKTIMNNEELYLCKIESRTGNHSEESFKLLVLNEDTKKNFKEEDIQLVGKNKKGKFLFEKNFLEGIKQVNQMDKIEKISLSGDDEFGSDNKNTSKTR